MNAKLSQKLRRLEDFLLSDAVNDDAMLLSELDGFLAGVIVCPDLIMPSEWMPVVWGGDAPVFDTMEQAQTVNDLIMGHYNDIIGQLDRGEYSPVYDIDIDDSIFWEIWMEGFWRSVHLRSQEWMALSADAADDEDVRHAVFILSRLHELASMPSPDLEILEIDEELENLAPDLIPNAVETLHRARLARANPSAPPANQNQPKVGRNDPCPCGSGKKFKKCCLN